MIMATLDALDESIEPLYAIRLGTKCAIDAEVSITGAFDDACAAWLGGAVVTDNRKNELIRREPMDPDLKVVIHVPPFQTRKSGLPRARISAVADVAEIAFQMAMEGDYLGAMKLNGICYASALRRRPGHSPSGHSSWARDRQVCPVPARQRRSWSIPRSSKNSYLT